jgi:ketosteroid isomerase-like protein
MHVQTLLDERAITHGLGLFARTLDSRDWARVPEVFADDITFNYGDDREQAGMAALMDNFQRFLDPCGPSQHLLGSIMIEVDGDSAVSRSYVQARHQGAGAKAHLFLDTNGEYIDRWQRRPEGWRIVRRDARWAIHQGDFAVLTD